MTLLEPCREELCRWRMEILDRLDRRPEGALTDLEKLDFSRVLYNWDCC